MLTYKEYIAEIFNSKAKIEYQNSYSHDEDEDTVIHNYSVKDAKGRKWETQIVHNKGDHRADVQFSDPEGKMGVTGNAKHEAHYAFSAMRHVLDYHTKKHMSKPENKHIKTYTFDSQKEGLRDKYREGSRSKLYRKMAKLAGGHSDGGTEKNAYVTHHIPVKRES